MSKQRQEIERSAPIIDIEIDRSGDGRTVTAYAAMFDQSYEVRDPEGHYDEKIARTAFNRAIGQGINRVAVVYNHGMTLWGTPSERFAMPLGTPVDIRSEPRGLLTVTRYAKTDLADEVLSLIADGAVRAMSFRGPVIESARAVAGSNGRPLIERIQLGLREYGPTPFPANAEAAILAVRSQEIIARMRSGALLTVAEIHEIEDFLASLKDDEDTPKPPADAPPVVEPAPAPEQGPSVEQLLAENAQRRRRT